MRLQPATLPISKQLMPVYDKPMIYYPLSVLMLAGVREVLVVSAGPEVGLYKRLLGDGAHLGINIEYLIEPGELNGIADAISLGTEFIGDEPVALILGDNIFHGPKFGGLLRECIDQVARGSQGCVLFGYTVKDPWRYGVAEFDEAGRLVGVHEKPENPPSKVAVAGLYLYGRSLSAVVRQLQGSMSGGVGISDVNRVYVEAGRARMVHLTRGFAWLDTGTHESLLEAARYVQTLERRQGLRIACLEEIALGMGYISADACRALGGQSKSEYGEYVKRVAEEFKGTNSISPGLHL